MERDPTMNGNEQHHGQTISFAPLSYWSGRGAIKKLTMHNSEHHISLAEDIRHIKMVGMRTTMNNAIHVKVQMIELREERRVRNDMVDLWIAFADPSVELQGVKSKV